MKITLGQDDYLLNTKKESVPVCCNYNALVNAHMLVMGKTGMGKTTFLMRTIRQMQSFNPAPRIHVMDVHGDIEIPGASSVRFSESTEYGLNPFIVSPDPHFGGVRKKVQDFITTIDATHSVGPRQEAVMRYLITDLYAANGFYAEKPNSWSLHESVQRKYPKRYPTMEDAHRFAWGKLKQLTIGSDSKSGRALEELNKTTSKIFRNSKDLSKPGKAADDALIEKAMELRADAIKLYTKYVENIETGHELDDFIKYESKDLLKSVCDRLSNLKNTGIFKNQPPPFDPRNPVWRYDITALREDEKRMFVEFRLQELFSAAMEAGINRGGKVLRDIFIIDEAHLFFREDSNNILNTIAKEGRKFGLGLICASQSPTHFSEDFFANVATKVVLGVDQMYWDNLVKKMKVDAKSLNYIKPLNVMGVQMNIKGEMRSRFTMVKIPAMHQTNP